MAAIKFFIGFFCLVIVNRAGHIFSNSVTGYGNDEAHQRIVAAARKEIGTREGSVPNTGKRVEGYLGYVGIRYAAPWCAAFVSYVHAQAGYKAPKTAWSPDLFPAKRLVREARPGVVLGIYFDSLKRIAHCGIVVEVKGSWVFSVEGNTNLNGSREGDGVYKRQRHKRSIRCYADWGTKL